MIINEEAYEQYLKLAVRVVHSEGIKLFLVVFLVVLLHMEYANAYSGERYREVCKRTLGLMHGGFGALLMASAGVGAIVASAAGGFRIAWALVVVAVGAFVLKEYQEIWTAEC
jgi:hypothetical protein